MNMNREEERTEVEASRAALKGDVAREEPDRDPPARDSFWLRSPWVVVIAFLVVFVGTVGQVYSERFFPTEEEMNERDGHPMQNFPD